MSEAREALRKVLAQHKRRHKTTGDASDDGPRLDLVIWATCTCGWEQAIDPPSDAPAWEAHRLWREHLLDVLAAFVDTSREYLEVVSDRRRRP